MKKNYEVVLCLDVTGSMCDVIKDICQKEFDYLSSVSDKIRAQADGGDLSVTVVQFRDIRFDEEDALTVSRPFVLPNEKGEFKEYLDGIHARGGGDEPESALEALIEAKKHFGKEAYRRALLLFTNAPYKEPFEYVPYAEKKERLRDMFEETGGFSAKGYTNAIAVVAPNCWEWQETEDIFSTDKFYYFNMIYDGNDSQMIEKAQEINDSLNMFFCLDEDY